MSPLRCGVARFASRVEPTVVRPRCFSSTSSNRASWGFIGLGQMGYNMAKNLRLKIAVDDVLFVQDVNPVAVKKFVKETAGYKVTVSNSARDLAENSETVFTALPSPPHVISVYDSILSPGDLPKLDLDRLFIDTSTIDPATSISVASKVISSSSASFFVDAPMSGGVVGARAGTLTFMLGAPENLVARATSSLSPMARRVLHLGPPGSGLKAKLANNYLLALNNLATCEAMHMGISWGLDSRKLADLINVSTGKCWPSEVNNPVPGVVPTAPASRDYEGGFGVALMTKDLKLALKACEDEKVKTELGAKAKEVYEAVEGNKDFKGKDFSVVYRWLGGKE